MDLEEIVKEKVNVVHDSDGIVYLACYKHKASDDIELMYAEFFIRIANIENELWKTYELDERVIALTSSSNFRHDLTDRWKDDRKAKPIEDMTDKQLEAHTLSKKLRTNVSQVKALLVDRLGSSIVSISQVAEADDKFIDLVNNKGYIGVAMDSDCITQARNPVFNYHGKHWKWMHEGRSDSDIFKSIIHSTLVGGHNGSFGVKGIGKKGADEFILKMELGLCGCSQWSSLFVSEEDALLNYQVADCSQVVDDKLTLLTLEDIENKFNTLDYYEKTYL